MQGWALALPRAVAEDPAKALELAQQLIDEVERYNRAAPHLPVVLGDLAPLALREGSDSALLWSLALRTEAAFKEGHRRNWVYRFAMFLVMIPFAAAELEVHAFEEWWEQQVTGAWAGSPVQGKRDQLRSALDIYGTRFDASVRARLTERLPPE